MKHYQVDFRTNCFLPLYQIREIAAALLAGKCAVLPTDTGYMFAADATNEQAVEQVYLLKNRDFHNPMHVAVANLAQAQQLAYFTPKATALFERFMPGAFTLVLPKKPIISDLLVANTGNLGIRIPYQPFLLQLCTEIGVPLTATSVNLSGQPPLQTVEQIQSVFGAHISHLVSVPHFLYDKPSTVVGVFEDTLKFFRVAAIEQTVIEAAFL